MNSGCLWTQNDAERLALHVNAKTPPFRKGGQGGISYKPLKIPLNPPLRKGDFMDPKSMTFRDTDFCFKEEAILDKSDFSLKTNVEKEGTNLVLVDNKEGVC